MRSSQVRNIQSVHMLAEHSLQIENEFHNKMQLIYFVFIVKK